MEDLVFFGLLGLGSFDFVLSVSLPAKDLREIELNVFLCSDLNPSSPALGRLPSLDFFGDNGG